MYTSLKALLADGQVDLRYIVDVVYEAMFALSLPFRIRARIVPVLADIEIRLDQGGDPDVEVAALCSAFFFARAQGEVALESQNENFDVNMRDSPAFVEEDKFSSGKERLL